MLDQGPAVGLGVMWPVEIYGQWHTLSATASVWASEASSAATEMESAAASWTGLVASYREAETQEVVRTALDEAPRVTREWADVAGRAADVLQSFATEANGLQQQAAALESQATRLQGRLWASGLLSGGDDDDTSAEDAALRGEIEAHNSDVMALNSRWEQLEQQTASEIDTIAGGGGYEDEIPIINTDGIPFSSTAGGLGAGGVGFRAGGAGSAALGIGFQSAVAQMIRSGNNPSTGDPVETATELYEIVTSDEVTGQDMTAFYDQLAEMDADQIEEFAEANPQINHYSMPQPSNDEQLASWPTGKDGAQWWKTMSDNGTQNAMLAFLPLLTGNVRGVPAETRHEANLDVLDILRESGEYSEYEQHLASIEDSTISRDQKSHDTERGQRFLLSLDVGTADERDRQPLAEVAVGNPDKASEVTYNVPGMNSGTHNMTGEVNRAQTIFNETTDQAVVAWMGYDPPTTEETVPESLGDFWDEDDGINISWDDLRDFEGDPRGEAFGQDGSVLNDVRADEGSYRFAHAIEAQQSASEARGNTGTGVKVIAHSYGTNMVSHALTLDTPQQRPVDSVIFMGSSGIPESVAASANDLNVEETEEGKPAVFVTEAEADEWAHLGRGELWFGLEVPDDLESFDSPRLDPREEAFNAYVFSSDADQPFWPWNEPDYESVTGHSRYAVEPDEYGYQQEGTLSFKSMIEILRHNEMSIEFESTPNSGSS